MMVLVMVVCTYNNPTSAWAVIGWYINRIKEKRRYNVHLWDCIELNYSRTI